MDNKVTRASAEKFLGGLTKKQDRKIVLLRLSLLYQYHTMYENPRGARPPLLLAADTRAK